MSASRSSRDKDRDDEYRSSRSHVYDKKRRRSVDLDMDEYDHRSSRRATDYVYKGRSGRDALADFRAKASDEEFDDRRSHRHPEPHASDHSRRRGRDRDVNGERERRLEFNDSHKENQRDHEGYPSCDTLCKAEREYDKAKYRGRDFSPDSGRSRAHDYRHSSYDEKYSRGSSSRAKGDGHSCADYRSQRDYDEERQGRTLSRSSSNRSNSRQLSSRSLSSSPAGHHSHKRKRRRSLSKSRSPDRGGKSRRHRRSPSRKKNRGREKSDSKRSVLTGKKIKLKVKKDKGDDERDAKRQELLQFLNSAYE